MARELNRIAQALEGVDNLSLATKGAEPDKYSDGDIVYADGTSWNPGSGEGVYGRYNSAWNALSGGGGGGASQLSDLSDVNTSTPTNRNALIADGVDFESRAIVEADVSDLGNYGELDQDEELSGGWRTSDSWTAFRGTWSGAPYGGFAETGTNVSYPRVTFLVGTNHGSFVNGAMWVRPDVAAGTRKSMIFEVLDRGVNAADMNRIGFNILNTTQSIIATAKSTGGAHGNNLLIGTKSILGSDQQIYIRESQNRVDIQCSGGLMVRASSSSSSDYCLFTHDGTDFNHDFYQTTHLNINDVPVNLEKSLYLREQSAADTDEAGAGQLFVKDNAGTQELWFRDDAGTETQLA